MTTKTLQTFPRGIEDLHRTYSTEYIGCALLASTTTVSTITTIVSTITNTILLLLQQLLLLL